MNKTIQSLMTAAVLFFWAAACTLVNASDTARNNIIILSLNALRQDHLGVYGYGKNTSPNIDRLSAECMVFHNAVAHSHWTLPSQASIHTSKYVHSHTIFERTSRLLDDELTLAEILKLYDYKTAAFVGGLDLVAEYGLDQGFDVYDDRTGTKAMRSALSMLPKIKRWIKKNRKRNFFTFVQFYDIHPPYENTEEYADESTEPYDGPLAGVTLDYNLLKMIHENRIYSENSEDQLESRDIDYIVRNYDAGIRLVDSVLGDLINFLDKLELMDNTILIITSEHGEELNDRGFFNRFGNKNLYDEVIRVPLIVRLPGKNGKKDIESQVQLVDIMPTVLDLLGIPVNRGAQGTSLKKLIDGEPGAEGSPYAYSQAGKDKWSVRTVEYKLIADGEKYELYDLRKDPGETANIASKNSQKVYELAQKYSMFRNQISDVPDKDNRIELTDEMKRKLKETGYW